MPIFEYATVNNLEFISIYWKNHTNWLFGLNFIYQNNYFAINIRIEYYLHVLTHPKLWITFISIMYIRLRATF